MKWIVIIALIIILTVVAVKFGIPAIKRKKLAEGWGAIAAKAHIPLSAADIKKELDKLPDADIDVLVEFSQDLQGGKFVQALKMINKVDPIIKKTNLGDLKTYLPAFIK